MSDVTKSGELPQLGPPMPLPGAMPMELPRFQAPQIHNHGPGEYCVFCSCLDCRLFYGRGAPIRCVQPRTLELSRPRYSYMGLVNSMRAAFAKREEDRQNEREGTATAAEAPKKDKTSKDQTKKKNLRQNMKRRRH